MYQNIIVEYYSLNLIQLVELQLLFCFLIKFSGFKFVFNQIFWLKICEYKVTYRYNTHIIYMVL